MISTARIQSAVRQLQQFDVAVSNFQTKYNQLPGDSNLFTNGDNNGVLDSNTEVGDFWSNLSLGVGLRNNKGTDYQTVDPAADPVSSSNCPQFNLEQSSSGTPCLRPMNDDMNGMSSRKNYFEYFQFLGSIDYTGGINQNTLKNKDALALDQKLDDGNPQAGDMLATCGSGTGYDLSNDAYACRLGFTIGMTNRTNNQ